jgi:hypothetical protein
MAFKLKDPSTLMGIDKETSTVNNPVFTKKLEPGIGAEANRDGTIFVDSSLCSTKRKEAVVHETMHLDQMSQGKLAYTDGTVTWKKDTRSPARVYTRQTMNEGARSLPWENEIYNKTKN